MKTRQMSKFCFLPIVIICWLPLLGQITIDQSDMPTPGDTLRKSTALNTGQFDFTETGSDHSWDFSGLVPLSQAVDTFVKVTETPPVYWLFFLTAANMASPLGSSPIEQIPLTEAFNFFNNTPDSYSDVGYAAMVFGVPLPFKFDDPDILYDFPVNYQNVDSSESGFEFALPDLAYLKLERKRVNTVDGWGDLRTPYGTFEVLRIKSEVTEYDSIYIDSLDIGLPINLEYTEYKWMAKGQKIPLLKVTENVLGVIAEYRDSIRDLTVEVPELYVSDHENLLVYPNPARQKLNVKYFSHHAGHVLLKIIGLDGRLVLEMNYRNMNSGEQNYEIDLSEFILSPGRYFLHIISGNEPITGSFIYFP